MRFLSCGLFLAAVATTTLAADDGFTPLFNGKDLTGWKTKAAKGKEGESLDGKTEAFGGRFKVKDGEVVVDAKVKGDVVIESKELSGPITIRFEFNPGPGCNNDLFVRGTKFDIKKQDIKNLKEGEWNEMEIVVKGGKAEFKVNGESIKSLASPAEKGVFGIRAELGPIAIRKIRVKEGG